MVRIRLQVHTTCSNVTTESEPNTVQDGIWLAHRCRTLIQNVSFRRLSLFTMASIIHTAQLFTNATPPSRSCSQGGQGEHYGIVQDQATNVIVYHGTRSAQLCSTMALIANHDHSANCGMERQVVALSLTLIGKGCRACRIYRGIVRDTCTYTVRYRRTVRDTVRRTVWITVRYTAWVTVRYTV